MVLHYDPEHTAHYDGDSNAVVLSGSFLRTVSLTDDEIELVSDAVYEYPEPAGYLAFLKTTRPLRQGGVLVDQTIEVEFNSDSPWLRLNAHYVSRGGRAAIGSEIGASGYDTLITDEAIRSPADLRVRPVVRLSDSRQRLPDLLIMVLDAGSLSAMRWHPDKSLTLVLRQTESMTCRLALAVLDGLYSAEDVPALCELVGQPHQLVNLDEKGEATITNPLPIPVTRLIRISGGSASPDPYHIREFGEWVFRGAQTSVLYPGDDYLKVYLPPRGSATICRYGFIGGVARVGWGCQYTMSLGAVERTAQGARVAAKVHRITSMIFAPRVRFADRIKSVRLDGRPWHYRDDYHVFLPNRVGEYRIEVISGDAELPRIERTFALVEDTKMRANELVIDAALPVWTDTVPDGFHFYATIRHPGRHLSRLGGAQLVRHVPGASLVRFRPGRVSLDLPPDGSQPLGPEVADPDRSLDEYLLQQGAQDLERYLKGFDHRRISLRQDISAHVQAYDVLAWYPYYYDGFPDRLEASSIDSLRHFVEQGGGLFLIEDGVRIVPTLLGLDSPEAEMKAFVNLPVSYMESGIRVLPDKAGSPIFEGLEPVGQDSPAYVLIHPDRWDVYKLVEWQDYSFALETGRLLATAFGRVEAVFGPDSPCLWEFEVGKGRIIAYARNLRRGHGTPDLWVPSENESKLVRNIICYASQGKGSPRVGLLW